MTDNLPKPLLQVGEETLMAHHLRKLKKAGIEEVYINTYYLGHMISDVIGDGSDYGLQITYIPQAQLLGSGGDTLNALGHFFTQNEDPAPFLFVSADIFSDFDYKVLETDLPEGAMGCLVMVERSERFPDGCQYAFGADGRLQSEGEMWNWASIAVLDPALFVGRQVAPFALLELFNQAVRDKKMLGL
ncbi:MAG: sugar phosphate nucleotidyltransferase, partial [Gammaproteobacteria bacterium]|nr:sugar phosphate nucleotidyltransferase [Gammaproteobacteria bacterium]